MKVKLEFQYFEDCPNHNALRENLMLAIRGIEDDVEIAEIHVPDEETATKVMFRGSPTLLINGDDLDGMPSPGTPHLACRFYQRGIPSAGMIRRRIEEASQ